jgi:hypothetical protein
VKKVKKVKKSEKKHLTKQVNGHILEQSGGESDRDKKDSPNKKATKNLARRASEAAQKGKTHDRA